MDNLSHCPSAFLRQESSDLYKVVTFHFQCVAIASCSLVHLGAWLRHFSAPTHGKHHGPAVMSSEKHLCLSLPQHWPIWWRSIELGFTNIFLTLKWLRGIGRTPGAVWSRGRQPPSQYLGCALTDAPVAAARHCCCHISLLALFTSLSARTSSASLPLLPSLCCCKGTVLPFAFAGFHYSPW